MTLVLSGAEPVNWVVTPNTSQQGFAQWIPFTNDNHRLFYSVETRSYDQTSSDFGSSCGYSLPYNGGGCDTNMLLNGVTYYTGLNWTSFNGCYTGTVLLNSWSIKPENDATKKNYTCCVFYQKFSVYVKLSRRWRMHMMSIILFLGCGDKEIEPSGTKSRSDSRGYLYNIWSSRGTLWGYRISVEPDSSRRELRITMIFMSTCSEE